MITGGDGVSIIGDGAEAGAGGGVTEIDNWEDAGGSDGAAGGAAEVGGGGGVEMGVGFGGEAGGGAGGGVEVGRFAAGPEGTDKALQGVLELAAKTGFF